MRGPPESPLQESVPSCPAHTWVALSTPATPRRGRGGKAALHSASVLNGSTACCRMREEAPKRYKNKKSSKIEAESK